MRSASLAMLAMLALLVAGCEAFPIPRDEPSARPEAESAGAWSESRGEDSRVAAVSRPLPPRPKVRPQLPVIDPGELTGLTPMQAEYLLGMPDERAEEPPAVVWTYLEGPCRLELFFYYDLESQQQRSLTFDLAPGGDAEGARAFCFTELARRGAMARRLESVEEQIPGSGDNGGGDAGGNAANDTATGEEDQDGE